MISRRDLLKISGLAALATRSHALGRDAPEPDYRLQIAEVTLDLSPRHTLKTVAYNGQAPGPLLRFKEDQPVTIEVINRTDRPEVVHWHGLFIPPEVDGAMEEGTPAIAPRSSARYTFTPKPAGFRWYHTHTMAKNDLSRAQYTGQHGFLMIEPRENPAPYDQEFFLALHDWGGHLLASDDGAMSPSYAVSTINGRAMGSGEPLRVRQGQRVLLHILNSSPTEVHWLALAGHSLQVLALDGNAVPNPRAVPMLRLAPGERVCALAEMNNPGVWILGRCASTCRHSGWRLPWSTKPSRRPAVGSAVRPHLELRAIRRCAVRRSGARRKFRRAAHAHSAGVRCPLSRPRCHGGLDHQRSVVPGCASGPAHQRTALPSAVHQQQRR